MLKDKRFSADLDFDLVEELDVNEAETISGGFDHNYRAKIYANSEGGFRFENKTGQTQTFHMYGLGSWSYGGDNRLVGANGTGKGCGGCTAPHLPGAALILRRPNGVYEMVGEYRELTLDAGDYVHLLMNDSPGNFGNNDGWVGLSVIW